MPELTSIRKLKWEMRKKQLKETAAKKAKQASEFVKQNQEAIAVAVPAIAVGARGAMRTIQALSRKSAVKRDIYDRKTRFYDHKLGCYWRTKRELRPDELLAVQKRRKAGESYGDIFQSMKLLK